jgi:hypothetical protein
MTLLLALNMFSGQYKGQCTDAFSLTVGLTGAESFHLAS